MIIAKKQLLCTFANDKNYSLLFSEIKQHYTVLQNKIFVFVNSKNLKEYYLTYNIDNTSLLEKIPNTISIHRKKMYNTLYTLNAMNKLITEENNGIFDKAFVLNWELYKNCMILTDNSNIKIIELKLTSVYLL